jgi:hypothetical protein
MLRSIKQSYGDKLGASDGEIGRVKDFYFDDKHWVIRFLVADTGSWLPGRLVLISPHALGCFLPGGKTLSVNLTRKKIENSPAIDTHKPVSRQYEETYYRYYDWPHYWQGSELWGMSGFPILSERSKAFPGEPTIKSGAKPEHSDVHLRSAQAVTGYQIQAGDEIVGTVVDYLMNDKSWAIEQIVVNTGNRFTGKKVLLSPSQIERISFDESKVFVNLTKEAVERSPAYEESHDELTSAAH